ncbi:MAG TPA: hypothetical protein VFM63_12015 [Pyrinomonadaceae bacterium]|nr:hypothetical protein [Pyrinomonadaceae bacterium]
MISKTLWLTLFLVLINAPVNAQLQNLLQNPNADAGEHSWRARGEVAIGSVGPNDPHFVVRNGGQFYQDVELPKDAAGQYLVLIGRGATDRINPDGAITGLPALYGYMMQPPASDRKEILEYLQGQRMLGRTDTLGAWVTMSGIFKVAEGTTTIRFFLSQALRAGVPHNDSAARFDNLGLYLFPTKEAAEQFVSQYQ